MNEEEGWQSRRERNWGTGCDIAALMVLEVQL